MNSNDKLPPNSEEAELSVLSCCLQDPEEALSLAVSAGVVDQFYQSRSRVIFQAMVGMVESGKPLTLASLAQSLKDSGQYDAVGGLETLQKLPEYAPSPSGLPYWLQILWEKHYLRTVIRKCAEVLKQASEPDVCVSDMVDEFETAIFALRQTNRAYSGTRVQSLRRIVGAMEEAWHNPGRVSGIPTGFVDIDRRIGGLRPGQMITFAARPGMGKTALALNIADHLAVEHGIPVGFFSLEMEEDELNARSLASTARVNMQDAMAGKIVESDVSRATVAMSRLSKSPLFILDRSDMKISELRAEARRLVSAKKCQILVVDYLQRVHPNRRHQNKNNEVSEVSDGIKAMAKELKVPVIALAQLNRDLEKEDRRPRLSDLRDSGSIEQDSDLVCFLHCPDKTAASRHSAPVEFIIAKQRAGNTGIVSLTFLKEYTRFESASHVAQEPAINGSRQPYHD